MADVESPIVAECGVYDLCAQGGIATCFEEERAAGKDELLLEYPTVYVVYSGADGREHTFNAYVGETNDIVQRTLQHYRGDPRTREDWSEFRKKIDADHGSVRQFVIGHPHFNKSLTLDFENRMMHYLLGVDSVKRLNNRRENPQGKYYTQRELESIFTKAWRKLHHRLPELFPSERVIRDSALFKASPFHELSDEQRAAEQQIIDALITAAEEKDASGEYGKLIVVQGAAGTGKTVLISHLFNELASLGPGDAAGDGVKAHLNAFLLINHDEQKRVYDQIAVKLGLQKKANQVVLKPVTFINKFSGKKASRNGESQISDVDAPKGRADIALIDEAHLLRTQSNQAYQGSNMLLDVMRRAKVTVAVFDPAQILESAQQWSSEDLAALLGESLGDDGAAFSEVELGNGARIRRSSIVLERQFRIDASAETVLWIDGLIAEEAIQAIPADSKGYEIRVFDSPVELHRAICEKSLGDDGARGLSRLLATYDWPYSGSSKNPNDPNGRWNVELHREDGDWTMGLPAGDTLGYEPGETSDDRFCLPWNYGISPKGSAGIGRNSWAERPETIDEVGSTFTIQGFDLNYAGVIIGPSVKLRDGRIVFDGSASCSSGATNKRGGSLDYSEQNLRNELNVLLKRGVHGLYLFAVDPALQAALQAAAGD